MIKIQRILTALHTHLFHQNNRIHSNSVNVIFSVSIQSLRFLFPEFFFFPKRIFQDLRDMNSTFSDINKHNCGAGWSEAEVGSVFFHSRREALH